MMQRYTNNRHGKAIDKQRKPRSKEKSANLTDVENKRKSIRLFLPEMVPNLSVCGSVFVSDGYAGMQVGKFVRLCFCLCETLYQVYSVYQTTVIAALLKKKK
jgi:hypothetical protein